MIEAALYFILGMLCAAFFVTLVAPTVWRQSAHLARRRMEATLPLTLAEFNAEIDALRATHARTEAKLNALLREEREISSNLKVEQGKNYQRLKLIPELEHEIENLNTSLVQINKNLQETSQAKSNADQAINQQQAIIDDHNKTLDEFRSLNETLRIEISSLETEKSDLYSQLAALRHERKDANMQNKKSQTELNVAMAAVETERQRNKQLEEKLAKLITALSDAESKLERLGVNPANDAKLREEIQELTAQMVVNDAEQNHTLERIANMSPTELGENEVNKPQRVSLAQRIQELAKQSEKEK